MNAKVIKTKEKKWILKGSTDLSARTAKEKIAKELGINPIIADLLHTRGYTTPETAKNFLYMENEMLAGEDMVTKLHYGNYNQIHEIKLRERKIVFHIEVINRYGDITTYCTPELDLMYGVTLQEVIDAYGIWGVDYTWEMIDVGSGYVSVPIDFSYSFALPLMVDETYICENNATYLLRATSVHFAADGSGG